jgi:hypothetical protein
MSEILFQQSPETPKNQQELLLNECQSNFEQYLTPNQEKLRHEQLQELQELLKNHSNFNEKQLKEIITQAKCLWPLLNPGLKTHWGDWSDHPIRFKSKQEINPNFVESNWWHSMDMIRSFYELKKTAPELVAILDEEKIIKTIINHDCGEIVNGDIEAIDQTSETIRRVKQEAEKTAFAFIGRNMSGIDDPHTLYIDYESRSNIESYVVKAIDQRSGDASYFRNIVEWIHNHPDGESIYLKHQKALEDNNQPNENNRNKHYGKLFEELDAYLEGLGDVKISEQDLENFKKFFTDAPTQKADSFNKFGAFSELWSS